MNPLQEILKTFLTEVKSAQTLWGLIDESSGDWVVADSGLYQDCDVMPLWSNKDRALACCVDQWQGYLPQEISLSDWFEYWVEDLNQDGVCIGVNWQSDIFEEMDLTEFAQAVAEIETL